MIDMASRFVKVVLAVVVLVTLATGYTVWRWVRAPGTTFDVSRVTVVRQVQQLARLDTVMFGMDKIVSGNIESRFLPSFLGSDRILLIAYGEVTAGVDLAKIGTDDVSIDGKTLRLKIPPPEIFTTRIDNERTRVYSRQTGLFTRVDPNLETEVRREAERQIRQAAIDSKILDVAAQNARTTLRAFIGALGFAEIDLP